MLTSLYFRKRLHEDGFTLIELLIVVIIIGLLAAIALPIFIDQTKTSVDASVKSDVRNTVTNVTNAQSQATATVRAALSNANTSVALETGTGTASASAVIANGSANTFNNVPKLGMSYTVYGWNPNGKAYLGTSASGKGPWSFNSASGLFSQVAGPIDGVAADDPSGAGSTGGSSTTAPVWSGGTTMADGTVGSPYSGYTVTASGTPNPTYAAPALASYGLSINQATGVISGTPTATYNGSIVVTASNSAGSVDKTFTLKITSAVTYTDLKTYNFESGTQSWSALYGTTSQVAFGGSFALKASAAGAPSQMRAYGANDLAFVAGKTYKITAKVYVDTASTNVKANVVAGGAGMSGFYSSDMTTTKSWQPMTLTFTADGSAPEANAQVWVRPVTGTTLPGGLAVYVDDVVVLQAN